MRAMRGGVLVLLLAGCGAGLEEEALQEDGAVGGTSSADDADAGPGGLEVPDASVADAGGNAPADAGTPVVETAEPIEAPALEWTWVDVEGARCANGSPTGIGVNPVEGSDELLLFLQGGGACWDGTTCWGPAATSFYVRTGYGRFEFATDILRPALLPLRRNDPFNPFNRMNMVYVPYCTGDVHSGDRITTYEFLGVEHRTYHVGARNLDLIIQRLVATHPNVRRIWLAGDSAGGFGAAINMDRVQQAFPQARVDVLDDSGQPIQPDPARWEQWRAAWNLQIPSDCQGCASDVTRLVDYYRIKYPDHRFGLISYTNDAVITSFMGLPPTTFWNELQHLASRMDSQWENGHYYFMAGALHVGLATPTPGLIRWLEQMINDDPEWESRQPF